MAELLFKLHQVPEDEAEEVRQLLAQNAIATYETQAGFWGLGVSAIWLVDADQLASAKALLADYQAERSARQQALKAEQQARGEAPSSLWQRFRHQPIRVLLMLLAVVFVLGLSILPFIALIGA